MHPIVAQMDPSAEQKPAILARGQDVVVTAGAGAGKTRTLVARYLSLLAEGLELRSIVAITFTRKAAREMRNRVREEVRRYTERQDLAEGERDHWRRLYSGLDAARIDTIHGLCTDILRSHPAEARVDPRFQVLEEGTGQLLQTRAVDEALAWAADDAQGVELFTLLGEQELRNTLAALLGKRLDAVEAFTRLQADVLGHWRSVLSRQNPSALGPNPLDDQAAGALPALRATLWVAVDRLESFKSDRNALDFDDLEARALRLLQQNAAVRAYWQAAVRAILIDEFQDTNQRQRDLVALLNDGGKLFIVGDAKQSIYRFRGADVTVFRRERQRIKDEGGAHFAMDTSYRAHNGLIAALNDLLAPVLGEQADPARPWVEPFSPLAHHRQEPAPGQHAPYIELHLTAGSKNSGALDRAAQALAARVASLLASGAQAFEEQGRPRPLNYGDVAILCRASTSFPAYENALERAGIPYLTVAGSGFHERPEIRDLLNGLHALADPTDDLALVGLLRSPGLGLSDADLFRLCRTSRTAGMPLWAILQAEQDGNHPWADDPVRARRAVRLIADLHQQVGRTSVADLLKAFLDKTDYRAAWVQTGDARGARNVDKLLDDAHTSGIVGVGEFLEYWDGLKSSGVREGEARAAVEGAVQIMSVHQAKGLEFPIVVIGDLTHTQRIGSDPLIDPDLGIVLKLKDESDNLPGAWKLASLRDGDQEAAESNRLFYVAATRAKERLILSGCIRLNKGNTVGKADGWLGTVAGPDALRLQGKKIEDYRPDGDRAIPLPLHIGSTVVGCTLYEPGCATTPIPRPAAQQPEPIAPQAPPLLGPPAPQAERADARTALQDRVPAQRVWRVVPGAKQPRAPAWVVGSLVHEALAAWRFPEEQAASGFTHDYERWAEARARGYGLADSDQLADAVRRSRDLLRRFHDDPLFREMDGAERRLQEVPYSVEVEGQPESGIIDALYLSAGRWTIIEFKTDELRNQAELDRLLVKEDYRAQAERYQKAAERLLGHRPRVVLCLLNYAQSVRRYELDQGAGP